MPGHTLSLYIPHSIKVDAIHYWPRKNIQGAQHININSSRSIRVTHDCSNTASITPQLHLPAPPHEPIHHTQDHSPSHLTRYYQELPLLLCCSRASTSKCSSPSTWIGSGGFADEPPGMCFLSWDTWKTLWTSLNLPLRSNL